MKNISRVLIGAVSAGILATPLSANALTNTFSNEATFLSNVNSGFYLENFNSLSDGNLSVAIPFNSGGFAYTVTAIGGGSTLFSGVGNTGSRFLGVSSSNDSINISFTSGNVTAVGGTFFLTSAADNLISGQQITIALNDGTSVVFTPPNASPLPFTGFTSDTPITSLSFSAPTSSPSVFETFDNFYVGTAATLVPFEFSPALGLGVLGALVIGRKLLGKKPQS
jgi:hypothetical protein